MSTKLNINAIENGIIPYEKLNNDIIEKINSKSDKTHTHDYLPLSGGTMSNDIDMNLHSIIKTGVDIVESLPTENLFNGRQVTYEGKLYTYNNNEWNCIADDLGGKPETHEENFVYQPTASDLSIKDGFADIKKLKGNTVVWNQLNGSVRSFSNYGVTQIQNDDGTFTLNGTATQKIEIYNVDPAIYKFLPIGHKGLFDIKHISGDITGDLKFSYGQIQLNTNIKVIRRDSTNYRYLLETIPEGCVLNNATFSFQVHDLTQMFGEDNEPATVEEFEAMFPNEYYEYNEGELLSFDGKGVKSVGFNLFDKTKVESESYLYHTNGISTYHKGLKESVSDFIRVIPSTKYYVKNIISNNNRTTWVYDSNKMPLTTISASTTDNIDGKYLASREITIPDNAHYIRFGIYDEYLDSACINLSHSGYRDGEYQSYEDYTLSFQDGKTISQLTGKLNGEGESVTIFPDGLRSAGTVFDEITPDGKAVKRIGSVDMGALNWTYNDGSSNPDNYPYGYFINHLTTRKPGIKTIICTKYPEHNNSFNKDKVIVPATLQSSIYIVDSSYTDADSLKASLQGQILYYELETPEVYELDFPINTSYEAYDFGTEEVLYNDDKEVNIPMKANIEYNFNAVDMIRNNHFKIQNLKENLNELRTNSMSSLLEHDTQINNILVEIENNELVTATAITNLEDRTTNVENGLTNKSDIEHTHVSSAITDSIIAGRDITSSATGLVQGRAVYTYTAPANHASSATTYGVATTSDYGHVKIGSGLTVSNGVLSHPTTPGNKHIPSGGALGQCLKYNEFSGTVKWSNIFNYSKYALTYSSHITSPDHTSFICNESITIPSNSLCHVKLTVMSMGTSLLSLTPFGAKLYNESTIFDMAQGLLMPFVNGSPGQIDLLYFNNTSDDITEVNVSAYSNTNITLSSSLDGLIEGDVLPLASYYEIVSF